jgi:hypothetical protein
MSEYTLATLEKKADRINKEFGTDIEIERYNGAYRAVMNKQSKNLTCLTTKRDLWYMLDALEEGIYIGQNSFKKVLLQGTVTGRSVQDKPNFREEEKTDGRPRTEGAGK